MKFEIKEQFELDGKELKIISGSIHYWRSHHSSWEDKIIKLKALGANTVETYVPWNLHEPEEDQFDFTGNLDLVKFIELAQKHNMLFILRLSPYICAEHDFGGLPWWLLTKPDIEFRIDNDSYLQAVDNYLAHIIPKISPYTVSSGGNIVLGQLENEYGSYGNDKQYLSKLLQLYRNHGFIEPMVTSDGSWSNMLESGTLVSEGVLPTVNFGSGADTHFDILEAKFEGKFPLMCMEFWCGWFDAWGSEKTVNHPPKQVAEELAAILNRGSVNFYMFHGGTNFGFMNGANFVEEKYYKPHTASYDYDALLDEAGNVTEKYRACQAVISNYTKLPEIELTEVQSKSYGKLKYQGSVSLFNTINNPIFNRKPLNMEAFGQGHGYAVYESELTGIKEIGTIMLVGLRDIANVYIDGQRVMTTNYHVDGEVRHQIDTTVNEGSKIQIVVENMGRINYGPKLANGKKGILEGVFIDAHFHFGWNHYRVDMTDLSQLQFSEQMEPTAGYHRYTFKVEQTLDTYLNMSNFGKGVAFVNGTNIGRFWKIGPQFKLHVSSGWLKPGENEVIIFETEGIRGELSADSAREDK